MTILDFPFWLRATHFLNLLFISLLARSGFEILSAHPLSPDGLTDQAD